MSKTRRKFSAKFKADLVIELLKGEKDLNTLATENGISPNLLHNRKKEFLDNAQLAFEDTSQTTLRDKLAEERKEKEQYAKKVGQLTMQVDWLKKNLKKYLDLATRQSILKNLSTTSVATPEILNSDQGSQFTSDEYCTFIKEKGIRQSMDGKSRWADNIMIERWFRTFKYDEAYLTQYKCIKESREAIRGYIKTYNFEHCHSQL